MTDDERIDQLRQLLLTSDIAAEVMDRHGAWLRAVRNLSGKLTHDYDAALAMLRDSTDGSDDRPLGELVAECGLGLGKERESALAEGLLVHAAFQELLAIARRRALAGAESDAEIAQLLDRHARAFDSFDWAAQLLVVHEPGRPPQPNPKENTVSNPNKRVHRLKTWPGPFEAIARGAKTFDIRRDDRGFVVGETVVFDEWDPAYHHRYSSVGGAVTSGGYTGRKVKADIVWLEKGSWGLPPDLCVLGLGSVERLEGFES